MLCTLCNGNGFLVTFVQTQHTHTLALLNINNIFCISSGSAWHPLMLHAFKPCSRRNLAQHKVYLYLLSNLCTHNIFIWSTLLWCVCFFLLYGRGYGVVKTINNKLHKEYTCDCVYSRYRYRLYKAPDYHDNFLPSFWFIDYFEIERGIRFLLSMLRVAYVYRFHCCVGGLNKIYILILAGG